MMSSLVFFLLQNKSDSCNCHSLLPLSQGLVAQGCHSSRKGETCTCSDQDSEKDVSIYSMTKTNDSLLQYLPFKGTQSHSTGSTNGRWMVGVLYRKVLVDILAHQICQAVTDTGKSTFPSHHLPSTDTANNSPGFLMGPCLTSKF